MFWTVLPHPSSRCSLSATSTSTLSDLLMHHPFSSSTCLPRKLTTSVVCSILLHPAMIYRRHLSKSLTSVCQTIGLSDGQFWRVGHRLTILHLSFDRGVSLNAWCCCLPWWSNVVDVISAGHVEELQRRQSCIYASTIGYRDQRRAWPTGSPTDCNLPSSSVRSLVWPGMSRCQTTCSPTVASIQSRQSSCHCRSCFCQSRWSGSCCRCLKKKFIYATTTQIHTNDSSRQIKWIIQRFK